MYTQCSNGPTRKFTRLTGAVIAIIFTVSMTAVPSLSFSQTEPAVLENGQYTPVVDLQTALSRSDPAPVLPASSSQSLASSSPLSLSTSVSTVPAAVYDPAVLADRNINPASNVNGKFSFAYNMNSPVVADTHTNRIVYPTPVSFPSAFTLAMKGPAGVIVQVTLDDKNGRQADFFVRLEDTYKNFSFSLQGSNIPAGFDRTAVTDIRYSVDRTLTQGKMTGTITVQTKANDPVWRIQFGAIRVTALKTYQNSAGQMTGVDAIAEDADGNFLYAWKVSNMQNGLIGSSHAFILADGKGTLYGKYKAGSFTLTGTVILLSGSQSVSWVFPVTSNQGFVLDPSSNKTTYGSVQGSNYISAGFCKKATYGNFTTVRYKEIQDALGRVIGFEERVFDMDGKYLYWVQRSGVVRNLAGEVTGYREILKRPDLTTLTGTFTNGVYRLTGTVLVNGISQTVDRTVTVSRDTRVLVDYARKTDLAGNGFLMIGPGVQASVSEELDAMRYVETKDTLGRVIGFQEHIYTKAGVFLYKLVRSKVVRNASGAITSYAETLTLPGKGALAGAFNNGAYRITGTLKINGVSQVVNWTFNVDASKRAYWVLIGPDGRVTLNLSHTLTIIANTPALINKNTLTVSYTYDGASKRKTFTDLEEGENTLTITEMDPWGNKTSAAWAVTVDRHIVASWVHNGTGSNLWSDPANWSGGIVPREWDTVNFDSGSGDCVVDSDLRIRNMILASGYTGTITQQADVTVTGDFTQSGGKWIDETPTEHAFSVVRSFSLSSVAESFNRYGAQVDGAYQVRDVYDLEAMNGFLASNFKLSGDLDVSSTARWNNGQGFQSIGSYENGKHFVGSFDGADRIISGLWINRPSENHVGLFGAVGEGSSISNVGLQNINITADTGVGGLAGINKGHISNAYAKGMLTGRRLVGGLVGSQRGDVSHSYAEVNVIGVGVGDTLGGFAGYSVGNISDSYATGSVTVGAGSENAGGFIGRNESTATISNSYATGAVIGGKVTGGFAAYNLGNISNSHSAGSVTGGDLSTATGGLVGYAMGTIVNSYATGAVIVGSKGDCMGGLVGRGLGTISDSYATGAVIAGDGSHGVSGFVGVNHGLIKNAYSTGTVVSGYESNSVGGFAGANHGSIENASSSGSITTGKETYGTGGFVGYNDSPATISNSYATGDVSGYLVTGGLVGYNYGGISNSHSAGAVAGTDYVGGLVGYNSSTISGSYSSSVVTAHNFVGGLVGYSINSSSISDSHSEGAVSGTDYVGGLVGMNNKSIISGSYSSSAVAAHYFVGGLAGYNFDFSTISDSYSTGAVFGSESVGGLVGFNNHSSITGSYSSSTVAAQYSVGGLAGYNFNSATISASYSTGTVSGTNYVGALVGINNNSSDISASYAIGAVKGAQYVGGLVGSNINSSTISNAYTTSVVTGNSSVGGLAGYNAGIVTNSYFTDNTHGSQTGKGIYESGGASAFYSASHSVYAQAGLNPWDFTNVWDLFSLGLPHLKWE